jgi:hypothetical protein
VLRILLFVTAKFELDLWIVGIKSLLMISEYLESLESWIQPIGSSDEGGATRFPAKFLAVLFQLRRVIFVSRKEWKSIWDTHKALGRKYPKPPFQFSHKE